MSGQTRRAIGLISGTSLDGIDVAGLETDGRARVIFAYLAVRSLDGRPLGFPGTTGAKRPITGGRRFHPAD
jgi:anhydro-N-acetylmuramic acid kinase